MISYLIFNLKIITIIIKFILKIFFTIMVLYDSIQNKSQKGFVMSIKEYFKFEERKTLFY